MGTADTPAEPISGLIFPWVSLHITFPSRTPPAVPKAKATRPRTTIFRVFRFRKASAAGGCSYGSTKQDNDDVHQSVGSGLGQLFYNAGLTEQVTKHQHTNQGSGGRKDQADNDGDHNREEDLLQFGYRTELLHLDLPLFLGGQKLS